MAHVVSQAAVLLDTSEFRSSTAPLPDPHPGLCFIISHTTSPGFDHAEYYPQSLFSAGTSHSASELDQWLQHTPLGGDPGADYRLRAHLPRLHSSQPTFTSRTRCGIVDSSFSFAPIVDTHIRLFVDNQHSPRRTTAFDDGSDQFVLVCGLPPGRNFEGIAMAGRDVYFCVVSEHPALGSCFGSNSQLEVSSLSQRFVVAAKVSEYDGPPTLSEIEQGGRLRRARLRQR